MSSRLRKSLSSLKTISSLKITIKTRIISQRNLPIQEFILKTLIDSRAKSTPCHNWERKSTYIDNSGNDSFPKIYWLNNLGSATTNRSKSDNSRIWCWNVPAFLIEEKNNFLSSENMKLKTKISTLEKEILKMQKILE